MVRQLVATATLACAFALVACSGGGDAPTTQTASPEAPAARTPTVIDDQLKALEKAKAIQATLDALAPIPLP